MEYWRITFNETPERRVVVNLPQTATQQDAEGHAVQVQSEGYGAILEVTKIDCPVIN